MISNKGILFAKVNGINGKTPKNGMRLEILVDGEEAEKVLIQSDLGNPKTHARIIGLGSNEKISYPLRDPENYTDIIEIVKRLAKKRYQKKVLGIYFGPKIETRSYSLM